MDLVTESVDRPTARESSYGLPVSKSMEDVWEWKREEARASRLPTDVEIHGVQKPITVVPPHEEWNPTGYTMGQGHHRVAAAKIVEDASGSEYYIPVQYDEDFNYGHHPTIWPYGAQLT
jgi:hypothetical protein